MPIPQDDFFGKMIITYGFTPNDAKINTEIAKKKMPDLNTENLDSAIRSISGTARSMGIQVID